MCETRKIREEERRKRSEGWSEDIRRVVERREDCFLIWRRTGNEHDLEEYGRIKGAVKGWCDG